MKSSKHFQKWSFTGNPRLSNPSRVNKPFSPIALTHGAIGNEAFATVACREESDYTAAARSNQSRTNPLRERMLDDVAYYLTWYKGLKQENW